MFAHRLTVNSFGVDAIRDRAMNLQLFERYTVSPENVPQKEAREESGPIGGRTWWYTVSDRLDKLNSPRERFIGTIGIMHYGLSVASGRAMPMPVF